MTDDEAILAMTDDNLRHRERILPTEKAAALKQQVEAIKHQGARPGEDNRDAGKRSTQIVGERNGMNYKQVQRYIRLTELVLSAAPSTRSILPLPLRGRRPLRPFPKPRRCGSWIRRAS